jgi:hypothetical protein
MVRLSQWAISESDQVSSPQLAGEEFCPFFLNAAYHSAAAYLETNAREQNAQYLHGLGHIKAIFSLCSQRWKLGGTFQIRLLTVRITLTLNSNRSLLTVD